MNKKELIKAIEEFTGLTYEETLDEIEGEEIREEKIRDVEEIIGDLYGALQDYREKVSTLEKMIREKEISATPVFVDKEHAMFKNCNFGDVLFLGTGSMHIEGCTFTRKGGILQSTELNKPPETADHPLMSTSHPSLSGAIAQEKSELELWMDETDRLRRRHSELLRDHPPLEKDKSERIYRIVQGSGVTEERVVEVLPARGGYQTATLGEKINELIDAVNKLIKNGQ